MLASIGCVRRRQQLTPAVSAQETEPYEKYRGAEVAGKQILFKLDHCPSSDSHFQAQMTKFARELTSDDSIIVNSIGGRCLFLARSATLTVPQLLTFFTSTAKVNQYLAVVDPTAKVVHPEPNFVIRIKPSPSDTPFTWPDTRKESKRGERRNSRNSCVPRVPDDALFQSCQLWGLKNPDHPGVDIDVVPVWQRGFTGSKSVAVGVIDTGFDYTHPDLTDNVWSAPSEFEVTLGSETIRCPAGSHGYDALAPPPAEATSSPDPRCEPADIDGHGTHVAGIIGARGNNRIDVVGVNWQTTLISLKFLGPNGGLASDAIKSIEFAIQVKEEFPNEANLRVLNASWGWGGDSCSGGSSDDGISDTDSQNVSDEIDWANEHDILFVASAGEDCGNDNDVRPHYPSGFDLPNLISVTAIDKTGALAVIGGLGGSEANYGNTHVHVAAPGTVIYSTYLQASGYEYFQKSGTSMATPFVSGAAALILTIPECAQLHASDLKRVLLNGAVSPQAPLPISTHGWIDVHRSIYLCRNSLVQ
jgi:hypothetical protein